MKYECQNCGKITLKENLMPLTNITEKVAAGEIMPAGECPYCGAVCHEHKPDQYSHAFQMAFTVISEKVNPLDFTEHEILAGVAKRLEELLLGNDDTLQACEQYDCYKI